MKSSRIGTEALFSSMFFILVSVAHADEIADFRLQKIMGARSVTELQALATPFQAIEKTRTSCQAEFELGLPPAACFAVVESEDNRKNLLALCLKRARASTSVEILTRALRHKELPSLCREALESRRRDLEYMKPAEFGPIFEFSGHHDGSHAL